MTTREERRLIALIAVIIAAAAVALWQITAARAGGQTPIAQGIAAVAGAVEIAVGSLDDDVRSWSSFVAAIPSLERENASLRARNDALLAENARLREELATLRARAGIAPVLRAHAHAVEARVIAYDPENMLRSVTIDRGSSAGIRLYDGVLAPAGVVGRVVAVTPLTATVQLITDYESRIPAIVRRGHWWGIAGGNLTSVRMQYVSLNAPLHVGETVITGAGRSFDEGEPIGEIVAIERNDAGLYQTAIVRPFVHLDALDRVVVTRP